MAATARRLGLRADVEAPEQSIGRLLESPGGGHS
jgi:hypothetical protein